jgi:hypothetical protein
MNISPANFIWLGVLSGIIATAGMTFLLNSITKAGIVNADMVRAVGSLFTKSLTNAFQIGLVIHFISGIIFALVYTWVIVSFQFHSFLSTIGSGALIGFIHGAVVSFLLVASVAENHPVKEFQEAGFSVAVAHWGGHILYGLIVGAVIGLVGY